MRLFRSKPLAWTLIVLPGLWPAYPIFVSKDATVLTDPLKYILHHFGFVACLLLVSVLTFTPLRVLLPKWGIALALNRHRRLVGVGAFAYGLLHFTTHLVYEGAATDPSFVPEILRSAVDKPFQLTGLVALTLLLILALTSLHAAVRWLGGKAWKNIHRLAYVAAALVAYHQIAARKVFPSQVLWIFGPLILLELARIVKQRSQVARVVLNAPSAAHPQQSSPRDRDQGEF